jgi:hypothetical protein
MIFPPPDLPNIPKIQPELTDYLRRFAVWANKQMQYKIPNDEAQDHFLLRSSTGKVYKISVSDTGTVTSTLVPLGSHP